MARLPTKVSLATEVDHALAVVGDAAESLHRLQGISELQDERDAQDLIALSITIVGVAGQLRDVSWRLRALAESWLSQ